MIMMNDEDFVAFIILTERGPQDCFLFSCTRPECKNSKITSFQLERHTREKHMAPGFSVNQVLTVKNKDQATTTTENTGKERSDAGGHRQHRVAQTTRVRYGQSS